jgi:L-threonylcarbamoyladenylate synthase
MTQVSLETLIAGAQSGLLVSFPTDTVPTLAAIPTKAEILFTAKQRRLDKPLILMAARAEDLWIYVKGSDFEFKIWQDLGNQYWPGALTLVLPARNFDSALHPYNIPKLINPLDGTTIGIRVPHSPIAQTILAQTGPLATTSANLSGQLPLQTIAEIEALFPDVLTLEAPENQDKISGIGVPSTVVKWTGINWQILRQGAIELDISGLTTEV